MFRVRGFNERSTGNIHNSRISAILLACEQMGILGHRKNGSNKNDMSPKGEILESPQHIRYGFFASARVIRSLKGKGLELAAAMNEPQGTVSVEIDGDTVFIVIEKPREEREIVWVEDLWGCVKPEPGKVILGMNMNGEVLTLPLDDPATVHLGVVGSTGSGKSTLLQTMILTALMGGSRVALFDIKESFRPLSGHPSVWRGGMFSSAAHCARGLEALARCKHNDLPLLLFMDEVPTLVSQEPSILDSLAVLAQSGRHANIHLVVGTQNMLSGVIGSETVQQLNVRVAGRVVDKNASYWATGQSGIGANTLAGAGDMLICCGGRSHRFQAAMTKPQTLKAFSTKFPPRSPRVPPVPRPYVPRKLSSDNGNDSQGRPQDDIPDDVLKMIRDYHDENGKEPSLNWIYEMTRETQDTGGYNRDKARRALELALE
jgi:hypothetical protein